MNANVTIELGFKPYPHQRAAHALLLVCRFLVLVWHRRAGKTVFAVMELLLAALRCERPRGRYGYIAPYLHQAKEIAWSYLLDFTRDIPGCTVNVAELSVTLPNGARIRLYGADNPDALRGGYFDGVVLDEKGDMKPHVWGEIVRPMLADREGWAIFIGTPKGVNQFSELYFDAISGKREGWRGDLRRARDTGVISDQEIEAAREEMSPQQFSQEFDCDFAAAQTNALLSLENVLAAQKRAIPEREFTHAPKVLGVDVAREGDDRSCIFLRQGLVAFEPRVLRIDDLMTLAGQAAEVAERHQPAAIFVDKGGMGSGVEDRLRQLGYPAIGVDFGWSPLDPRFANKRTEMWWAMAEWVRGGGSLPASQELVVDLTAPEYRFANDKGKVELESKAKMKKRGLRSPDVGDALALTFAMPVAAPADVATATARRSRTYRPHEGRV